MPSSGSGSSSSGDGFEPGAAEAIVASGLAEARRADRRRGLGASMREASEVLLALGAVDGSTALGFAMQVHVTGATARYGGVPR